MSWIGQGILGIIGLSAGVVIAGGLFSFIASLGVVSDLADRTHTGHYVKVYEDAITLGGVIGNIVYFFRPSLLVGEVFLAPLGILIGIFVGCEIMALAEVLNVFPIFIRRVKLVRYAPYFILMMALGKTVGEMVFAFYKW